MKLKCIHGFYLFEEQKIGQISDFMTRTGVSLVPRGNRFTFEDLADLENYSLIAKPIINYPATVTFQGEPWEVFEENNIVYDFTRRLMVPIQSVSYPAILRQSGNRFFSAGLLMAGSFTTEGLRIKSFTGYFSRDTLRWLYSEVEYV